MHQRFDVNTYCNGWLQQRLAIWAADPRTTTPQLHAALDEVLKSEPRPEWDAFAIKIGYLEMLRSTGAADPCLHPAGDRGGIHPSPWRHAVIARHDRSCRCRAPLPLARARTQPTRPATALCQLAGARGNARAAATETGRSGVALSADINEPDKEGRDQRAALPRRS